jgi:Diacylglycerol kinase catalytic domain
MSTKVIINPVCGDRTAPTFFAESVLPLLSAGYDVGSEVDGHSTVILGSGDGTIHDIINSVHHPLAFVLVPCGTANALYSSLFFPASDRLQSLHAFLTNGPTRPLSIASTSINGATPVLTVVVVSTALHASILHHSEALRQAHPGLVRFKIAAEQNANKWYNARVRLSPIPSLGVVQKYDPTSKSFVTLPDHSLSGPFAYFLSTVNVDRLEPTFTIAPLARTIPPPPATCDLVIIRPLRDPSIPEDTPQARDAFVPTLYNVLGAAYQDGAHVNLPIVEYIRCGGWEWIPVCLFLPFVTRNILTLQRTQMIKMPISSALTVLYPTFPLTEMRLVP